MKKSSVVIGLILLFIIVGIIGAIYVSQSTDQNLAVDTSKASTIDRILLNVSGKDSDDNIQAALTTDLADTNVRGAKIVLDFDKNSLEAVEINVPSGFIANNEKLDNLNGTISFDLVGTTQEFLTTDQLLANVTFKLKDHSTATIITLDSVSSLGTPNVLSNSGQGFTVKLN